MRHVEEMDVTTMQDQTWRLTRWTAAVAVLTLPVIAMQITSEVQWGPDDFVLAALLLGSTLALFEIALVLSPDVRYRAAAAVALGTSVLLLWAIGAVGIVGDEGDQADRAYLALVVGCAVGALVARYRASGMALVMTGTAALQVAIGIGIVAMGLGVGSSSWPFAVIGATILFAALWGLAAYLFAQAANTVH